MARPTMEDLVITVRDRREPRQFSVHNRLLDEWFPIIGTTGYTLYSFYVRLAGRGDERAFPGFASMQEHFGFSRATISDYNRLLAWCGLIHIERQKLPDGRRYRNDYFILPTPEIDEDVLERLRRRVIWALDEEQGAEKPGKRRIKFLRLVLSRVDGWQPIQAIWERRRRRGRQVKIVRAQLELDLDGADDVDETVDKSGNAVPQGNHPGSPGKPPRFPRETTPVPQGNWNNPYITIQT